MNHSRAYIKYCQQKRKHNLRLSFLALVLLLLSLITISYSWIEGITAISIVDNDSVSINTNNLPASVIVDGTVTNSVDLSKYIDNVNNLFFAPAKLTNSTAPNSYELSIKKFNDGSFRVANTNDIGNNYIELSLQIAVKKNQNVSFKFSGNSRITVGEKSDTHPIKVAFFVDGVYQKSVGPIFASEDAFSLDGGSSGKTYNLKVVIFADADYTDYNTFKGKTVNFDLLLETTIPTVTVSVDNVLRADIAVQYSNGDSNIVIKEGESADLPVGTEITLLDKTNYSAFGTATSGHKLDKFKINGVVSNLSNNGKYIINDNTTINATTKVRDFYIGGEGFNNWSGDSWDDRNNVMSYDSSNNTVTATIVNSINNNAKFKISMDGFNLIPNQSVNYRDSKNYSVTLNMSDDNIVSSGVINTAELSGSGNDVCVKIAAPVNTTITVTYELHTNKIRLNGVEPVVNNYTIYLKNSKGWATPKAYYWNDLGEVPVPWHGENMTKVTGNIWKVEINSKYNRVIFNNGGNSQTDDLTIPGDNYIYDYSTGQWSVYDPNVSTTCTYYFAVKSAWNSYTVQYNNKWKSGTVTNNWKYDNMTDTGKTYNGNKVWKVTFPREDVFYNIAFKMMSDSTQKDYLQVYAGDGKPITDIDNKMYVVDSETWITYNLG